MVERIFEGKIRAIRSQNPLTAPLFIEGACAAAHSYKPLRTHNHSALFAVLSVFCLSSSEIDAPAFMPGPGEQRPVNRACTRPSPAGAPPHRPAMNGRAGNADVPEPLSYHHSYHALD
jgi:hypothetical protein